MLVDTHCHLFFDELKNDIDGVLSRANELGVTKFICVGTDITDSIKSYKLAKKYNNIYFVKDGGWHFTYLKSPEKLEEKLLNFAHHYEFEQSGLKLDDIKKFMSERRVVYDHNVDQKTFKWSGKSKLTKIKDSSLPEYIYKNLSKFKIWLD